MNINQILINVGLLSVSHVVTSFFSFTLSRQTSQVVLGSQRHKATLCCSTAACCQRTTAWIGDIYFRKRLHQGSSSQDIIIYDVHLYISEYYLVQVMIHLMSKGIRSISSPMTIPVSYNFSSQQESLGRSKQAGKSSIRDPTNFQDTIGMSTPAPAPNEILHHEATHECILHAMPARSTWVWQKMSRRGLLWGLGLYHLINHSPGMISICCKNRWTRAN